MVIRLKKNATQEDINEIIKTLHINGFNHTIVQGENTRIICAIGDETEKYEILQSIKSLSGVDSVMPINEPYRLVGRTIHPEYSNGNSSKTRVIGVGDEKIGKVNVGEEGKPIIIAGPCTIYNSGQLVQIAASVKDSGADILRGGAFKPRTSPYDFQGLERVALAYLKLAREKIGIPVITEVLDVRDVEIVAECSDILQIGARNMQNYPLLKEVGKQKKPVMLKRHPYASMKEWLCSAEYIAYGGNLDIILCERGIRTPMNGEYDRNTLDFNVISALREKTFLPVFVDPSHGTGRREMIYGASKAAFDVGAHGIMVEVRRDNEEPFIECERKMYAYCDYEQSITISELEKLVKDIKG